MNEKESTDSLPYGCREIPLARTSDSRGSFVKNFNANQLKEFGLNFTINEEFYTISKRNVLRGLHFQVPPFSHQKLIYCTNGESLDFLVDLRKKSATFGKVFSRSMSDDPPVGIYLPEGIAHGFLALSDHTVMHYSTSIAYNKEADRGIHWKILSEFLPQNINLNQLIISERDTLHPELANFVSPF